MTGRSAQWPWWVAGTPDSHAGWVRSSRRSPGVHMAGTPRPLPHPYRFCTAEPLWAAAPPPPVTMPHHHLLIGQLHIVTDVNTDKWLALPVCENDFTHLWLCCCHHLQRAGVACSWCWTVLSAALFCLVSPPAGLTGSATSGKRSVGNCCIWSHVSEYKHTESFTCKRLTWQVLTYAGHPLLRSPCWQCCLNYYYCCYLLEKLSPHSFGYPTQLQ